MDNIQKICNEIALKYAVIIEEECRNVCKRFNCSSQDLVIEYHDNVGVKIMINASYFTIENKYTIKEPE